MAQKVTYSIEQNLIRVEAIGTLRDGDVMQAINDARVVVQETGIERVLVDQSRVTSVPKDAILQFNAGANMASKGFEKVSIAIVYSEMHKKDYEFVAQVTKARGGNLQLFTTEQEAMKWLDGH